MIERTRNTLGCAMFRSIARGALAGIMLAGAGMLPAGVTHASEDELAQPAADAVTVADAIRALNALPGLVWPDAPAPASLSEFVPVVRGQLWSQAIDGLRLPLHLRFVEARCGAEDEMVALVFEELRPPYLTRTYAFAVRRGMPTSPDDGWGGGYGLTMVLDDPEFVHLMGADTVECP